MALTFADTHNMITHLTKSDANEGFEQILDFLNASVIHYALTVDPTIYVSCIKQFWSSVLVKKVNDVVRLQALIDRKKVLITEDRVREVLHLDDAESIDYLPNEEIFAELARMRYEKPSTKLTFHKAFFSAQWKFLIHITLQSAQVGDLSSYATKYTFPALTQKVFVNMRRVATDDVDDVVAEDAAEPTLPSPTPTTTPPLQELPSTLQVAPTPPSSLISQPSSHPQKQQPSNTTTTISMDLFNTLLETCTVLTKRVKNLEQDKVAQSLKITKLKQRVGRLEKKRKLKGRLEESQAQVYHIDLEHADKVLSIQDDEPKPTELKEVIEVVTTAKLMTKVVTAATTTITVTPLFVKKTLCHNLGVSSKQ
nr:xylulose kinase-1 [Tanacetum cinerariifolium]